MFTATRVGTTVARPTTLSPTSGSHLVYERENGAPSTLNVSVAAVPEPASWG